MIIDELHMHEIIKIIHLHLRMRMILCKFRE